MVVMSDGEPEQAAEGLLGNSSRSSLGKSEHVAEMEAATTLSFIRPYEGCERSTDGFSQQRNPIDNVWEAHNPISKKRKLSVANTFLNKGPNPVWASPAILPVATMATSHSQAQFPTYTAAMKSWESSKENFSGSYQNLGKPPDMWSGITQPMVHNAQTGWQSIPHTNQQHTIHDFTAGVLTSDPTHPSAIDFFHQRYRDAGFPGPQMSTGLRVSDLMD